MKNIGLLPDLVSTKEMSDQDAAAAMAKRQIFRALRCRAISGCGANHQSIGIGARASILMKSSGDAMDGTSDNIAQIEQLVYQFRLEIGCS